MEQHVEKHLKKNRNPTGLYSGGKRQNRKKRLEKGLLEPLWDKGLKGYWAKEKD